MQALDSNGPPAHGSDASVGHLRAFGLWIMMMMIHGREPVIHALRLAVQDVKQI